MARAALRRLRATAARSACYAARPSFDTDGERGTYCSEAAGRRFHCPLKSALLPTEDEAFALQHSAYSERESANALSLRPPPRLPSSALRGREGGLARRPAHTSLAPHASCAFSIQRPK